ncbi:phospholipase D-like domain-containing protein [Bacillus atrophaeus]|uniref:phospholipase D-like domain-containing protein n=1 Tax=Bacillus atrophaeus TaxID=1452 RepID=UPI002280736D|nr:phospholipase D-like domain-containing protein [Bacillus atrophaeus]MCY8497739.1 phospholipase D-like domain-containing protein [Bacillus atrophaeus]MCY8812473.1 phospholipase D-like domain-containing protein [Bacillus atrophaeus]MCY8822359.1 phospholipase D-like domain-containing protein [Bacillus atrophaeus]MCY8829205.1 phospholipase D-like domain-containing protein [Bacillus atrophaeus]MCY8832879.1 phospholipase D-like domain-containing protein [Bacillus atrophaeus]
MHLDTYALRKLGEFINEKYIYRSGSDLVELFNEFGGYRDVYGQGFPSRKDYTLKKLNELNGTKKLEKLVNHLVHSRIYTDTSYSLQEIVESATNIIKYCGYSLELGSHNEYVIVASENGVLLEETPTIDVSFENIQSSILEYINKAEFHIWLSVAWFTDPVLFNALKEKAEKGVNIQIIINDDAINNSSGLNFEKYFETYYKSSFGAFNNNIYHNKFCVIDLKYSMSGSYNWSKKAQYNKEDYSFFTGRDVAEKYARQFIQLKLS